MGDLTGKYNTKLSKEDEAKFLTWAEQNNRLGDLENYDMRGWWKQNGTQDSRGHFTDEFKKPNHPTFSDESIYNGVDGFKGGKWGKNGEKDTFTPSKSNLSNMSAEDMKKYFSTVEPNAELVLPAPKPSKGPGNRGWYDNTPPAADATPTPEGE